MINYTWNCRTVDTYPTHAGESNVVYNVHWRVTGMSDQLDSDGYPYLVTNIGTQILSTSDITDFIPISEVTNEEVVEWTKAAMGEEQIASIEASIASQIEEMINPTSVTLTIGESN